MLQTCRKDLETFLHGSRPSVLPAAMQLAQPWAQTWRKATHHRNTCLTHQSAERTSFRHGSTAKMLKEKAQRSMQNLIHESCRSQEQLPPRSELFATYQREDWAGREECRGLRTSPACWEWYWILKAGTPGKDSLVGQEESWDGKASPDFRKRAGLSPATGVEADYIFALVRLPWSRTQGSNQGSLKQHKLQFCHHSTPLSVLHSSSAAPGKHSHWESNPSVDLTWI